MRAAMAAGEAVGPTSPLSDSRSAEFLPDEKQEDTPVEDTQEIHTHDAHNAHDAHDPREAPKNKMTNSSLMSWLEPVEVWGYAGRLDVQMCLILTRLKMPVGREKERTAVTQRARSVWCSILQQAPGVVADLTN